jgi:hypothetical protein
MIEFNTWSHGHNLEPLDDEDIATLRHPHQHPPEPSSTPPTPPAAPAAALAPPAPPDLLQDLHPSSFGPQPDFDRWGPAPTALANLPPAAVNPPAPAPAPVALSVGQRRQQYEDNADDDDGPRRHRPAHRPPVAPAPQASGASAAAVTPPVAPPPAVTPAPTAASAGLNTPAPAPQSYAGEPPADPAWLRTREAGLTAVRQDYEAQRAQAQVNVPTFGSTVGPGWVAFTPYSASGEEGSSAAPSGLVVSFQDPNAQGQYSGGDNDSYTPPPSQSFIFDEAAFVQHYQTQALANPNSALQTLAHHSYDTDAASLLSAHPEIWDIATRDHAINAGPAAAGHAMGNIGQLASVDFYMADPQVKALIDTYGGTPEPARGSIALEQVRIYGEARYAQMTRMGNAMQSVRDQYTQALQQAANSQGGPGWSMQLRPGTVYFQDGDNSGETTGMVMQPTFDVDAFTAWYESQDGLANKAFKDFYGASHTTPGETVYNDAQGRSRATAGTTTFDNASWQMQGFGYAMQHAELTGINLNDHPDLNDDAIVGFDLQTGWATPTANLHQDHDWLGEALPLIIVGAVAYFSAGTLGPAAATAMGYGTAVVEAGVTTYVVAGTAGAVISAAVAGAATSLVSGMLNDNLTLKGVLQGALSGALTAGVLNELAGALPKDAIAAGTASGFAANFTVNTAIQALMQGKITDQMVLANLASALGSTLSANIEGGIGDAVKAGKMSAGEAFAARTVAKMLTSAVKAMGSPDDTNHAFASAFVDGLVATVGDAVTPPRTAGPQSTAGNGDYDMDVPVVANPPAPSVVLSTVFDDDGNLMPGVVDTSLPLQQQIAFLQQQLQAQGLSAQDAGLLAIDTLGQAPAQALLPPSAASQNWTPQELQVRIGEVERALQNDLRAQQAREDSLLTPDDLREDTGGANSRVLRPGPHEPVVNGGFAAALNAAADVLGLFTPIREMQEAAGQVDAKQTESKINAMRQAMRNGGMANVPDGFEKMWVNEGGVMRTAPDYGATIDKLSKAYEGFVQDKRLRDNWGPNYENLRLGNSKMTVLEFETRTLRIQQQATNEAYERGVKAIATGQLPLKNGDYALTLGSYIDVQVRIQLRDFGKFEGLPDSGSSVVFAVNRIIRNGGSIGFPDLRVGAGLLSDVSLARKDGTTEQLRRWNAIVPNDTVIIRPAKLGGAYVVPRDTIQPAPTPKGKP